MIANPKYINSSGPTDELNFKLMVARYVFEKYLEVHCSAYKMPFDEVENLRRIEKVYFVGSEVNRDSKQWKQTSDLDIKLLVDENIFWPDFSLYKRNYLDAELQFGGPNRIYKPFWIDIFLVNQQHRVYDPKIDITPLWNVPFRAVSFSNLSDNQKTAFEAVIEKYRDFAENQNFGFDYKLLKHFNNQ